MDNQKPLDTLQDIKKMMERSSRFISLSGLSGVSAGVCALLGAYFADKTYKEWYNNNQVHTIKAETLLNTMLWIATLTFISAFVSAFIFTYIRSKKDRIPIFSNSTFRLLWNTMIPIIIGGLFILKILYIGAFTLIAPACLIFYGLALVNGSKYTLGEVRYLGYGQLVLGVMNLWYYTGFSIYFWAMGFGVLHILYGAIMWYKYEKNN